MYAYVCNMSVFSEMLATNHCQSAHSFSPVREVFEVVLLV
jgi:hypothetical protein